LTWIHPGPGSCQPLRWPVSGAAAQEKASRLLQKTKILCVTYWDFWQVTFILLHKFVSRYEQLS
jgi:hypothetical protein